jgi:nucleoid-associated protein YgaU
MTRETKIGLLVGLTFIIVVGVLLSDYMTSTREPQPAPLQMAGSDLRSGLGQPKSEESSPVAMTPPNVSPRQAVPTREELTPKASPKPAVAVANSPAVPISALNNVAQSHGEELVDANGQPLANNDVTPVAKSGPNSYTAEPGDSLSRIAAKTLGANTRANRAAIIAVNPSLRDNPNMIVVGKIYVIPTSGATAMAGADKAVAANPPVAAAQTGYVVKPGDTLWSIAVDQLGDAGAIAAIKDLNRDVLGDSDRIRPNMKLRLPAKAPAAAVASNT